ncbi:receptor like protein 27-like [Ziziphus jujuba]|uniref:Receptor like protein 27-like n=1 Tax=Ziziphus jujuba TaxID=326968 RepID=A0A6P6FQG9_ZIZJJ|nr:receptor like protein 27-like [Ziziphus jujuba]
MELTESLFFIFTQSFLKLPLLHLALILITFFFSCAQPLCHNDESIALLQFKDSFVIDKFASYESAAHPKTASWAQETNHDCCFWDGVKCDEETGHVIALHLNSSCLHGSINSTSSLFQLSQLQVLDLYDNDFNQSQIPSALADLSKLTYLDLEWSGFSGSIPSSIGKLTMLTYLSLSQNKLNGQIPYAFGNLSRLLYLGLAGCSFSDFFPPIVCKPTSATHLYISENYYLNGQIPSSLQKLTQLNSLDISLNNLSGQIPPWLGNLTQLTSLSLEKNNLQGILPKSFSRLKNLEYLNLVSNHLSGTVDFDMFLGMKNLNRLQLSANKLSVLTTDTNSSTNGTSTMPQFYILGLGSCNLRNFPGFLRYQNNLMFLTLDGNQIHGKVPKWVLNISLKTMAVLQLSGNFLTGFDQPPLAVLPWVRLQIFDISDNMLEGPLPIPPPSTVNYGVRRNKLSGQVSPAFCNLRSIKYIDFGDNKLSGMLPDCLVNLSDSLLVLNLVNNSFGGSIPEICTDGSQLRMIDLSYNKFEGHLPRSLRSCLMLQTLNLGNNQLGDEFPSWLGTLPDLRILMLRYNQLQGNIEKPISNSVFFPKIRVIDLSYNDFTGKLPSEYFQKWNSMKAFDATNSSYMKANSNITARTSADSNASWTQYYPISIKITIKGVDRVFHKIQDVFVVIDFSSNMLEGEIPESIGGLQGIRVLNLSNNILSGSIPSTLGNITVLESFDLSQNGLHGEIPLQLKQLTFLSIFNVSRNNLTGPIPQGNQFATFETSSYDGNLGLCGYPLATKCWNSESPKLPPPASEGKGDSEFPFQFDWITILPGYVGGLVVGIVGGNFVFVKKQLWFLKRQMKRRPRRRRGFRT